MKLSHHRALQGALLLSAAIFTICQARPQSTGTSTTILGSAELASHSQENVKTEEEAIRYNASAHSSRFLTANNSSNFTNKTWLEAVFSVSRNITGYHTLDSSLDSNYNVTAIDNQESGLKGDNNGLEKGNMALVKEGPNSYVGNFTNYSNSQDSWNSLKDQVENKSLKHLEDFSKIVDSVQIHIDSNNDNAELTDISTNSNILHEHKSSNSLEQNIPTTHQQFVNSSKILYSAQGSNCTQVGLGKQSTSINKHDEYISLESTSQSPLHSDTNNYTATLTPKLSPWHMPAYIYAQQSPNVQDDIPRDEGIISSYSQNISNPSVKQSNSSNVTTEHSVTVEAVAKDGQYEIASKKLLLKQSLTALSPANLSLTGESMSYSTPLDTQMNNTVVYNNTVYDLYATTQNMSLSNTNSSRARTESLQTLLPQAVHIAREFLKNQNVINTIKQWGGSLTNKFSKILMQSFGYPSEDEGKYLSTEAMSAVKSSNRKGKIFLKNGTEPLQLVYFIPAESALVSNDAYLQPKSPPKNQSSGAKTNVFSLRNDNSNTNVYRKRHNSSRSGNSTSVIRRYEKQKLLPKVRTKLIRRNNHTNLLEERKEFTRDYQPITVNSFKNNSGRIISRASNATHSLFNNASNGIIHQTSSWLPIGSSQTESSEILEFSQRRNSGKECIIKSSTGETRPCNRKRNTTHVTQKHSNQTPKTLQHGDGLVKNFVATNIHDLRIPSKEYPSENIGISSSSPSPVASDKNWPGDSYGIESLDDLILYHTYTQNKPSMTVKPQPDGGYVSVIKKPSVTLHWNQNPSTITSSPTVTYKPSKRPPVTVQNTNYVYDYDHNIGSSTSSYIPSTTMYPVVLITPRPTHQPSTHSPYYPPSYDSPLAQDEFYDYPSSSPLPPIAAPPKCPNIIISTKGNATVGTKENCPDVNILITSDITNNNVLVGGGSSTTTAANPSPPFFDEGFTTTAAPTMLSPPTSVTSTLSNIVSGMMSSQLAYPMLYFFLAPLLVVLTGGIGLAALFFPWMFAWRSLGREERRLQKKSLLVQEFDQSRRRRSLHNTCISWDWNSSSKGFSGMLHSGKQKSRRRKRSHEFLDTYHLWWKDNT